MRPIWLKMDAYHETDLAQGVPFFLLFSLLVPHM